MLLKVEVLIELVVCWNRRRMSEVCHSSAKCSPSLCPGVIIRWVLWVHWRGRA